MKLLIVIPALGATYGGTSTYAIELAQALGMQGISVDLVATNADTDKRLDVPLYTWIEQKSYRVQYFPYWGWGDYKFSWSMAQWLFAHVADYDLVHTNAIFSIPILPAYWACQRHRIPYAITPHGMLEPWALSYKAGKKRLYYNWLEKPAIIKAAALQMLATTEAEQVKTLGLPTPLVVIPNGVPDRDFQTRPDPELFYQRFPHTRNKTLILFLGRIDPKKGLDLLAIAFAQALAKFPQTHLIVAGPDNIGFLPTATNYFEQAGCLGSVTFTGMLKGDLKFSALAAASLFVAPSYSEGFSMSILEGMASGLPCVITTACNFPEASIDDAAHVVDPDSDRIAAALIQCLQDPKAAKAMGERARQLVLTQYTWERIAAKLIELYQTILAQASSC